MFYKLLFIGCVFFCYYITFEVIFNAIMRLLGFYDMLKEDKSVSKWDLKGNTSVWMGFIGAIAGQGFFAFYQIKCFQEFWFIPVFMVISCLCITITELLSGLLLNIKLKFDLWNYSNEPFNFKGQISLFRSIGWFLLGLIVWFINLGLTNILK